jgi:uncharacterized protein
MVVASLTLELQVPGSQSLKDKRQAIRSLRDKIRTKFNVSVAEVDNQDLWQRATIGVAVVSGDGKLAHEILDKVRALAEQDFRLSVLDAYIETW